MFQPLAAVKIIDARNHTCSSAHLIPLVSRKMVCSFSTKVKVTQFIYLVKQLSHSPIEHSMTYPLVLLQIYVFPTVIPIPDHRISMRCLSLSLNDT